MKRIGDFLRRVPTWVWVFLTLTQLIILIGTCLDLPDDNSRVARAQAIAGMTGGSAILQEAKGIRFRHVRILSQSAALFAFSATGAVLSWRRNRAAAAMK